MHTWNMGRWLRYFAVLGGMVGMSLMVCAAEKELPIGVAEFPPFKYTAPDGKIVGADTEIVEQVLRRMGYRPKIDMQPWKRVQEAGMRGQFAAIYSFTKNPDRERHFYFTDPLSTVKDVFYKLKTHHITWNTLDDLKHLTIGASDGYNYAPVFMDAIKQHTLPKVQFVTGEVPELQQLRMLILQRTDMFICEVSVCQYFIHTHAPEFDGVDFIDKPIGPVRTFHLGFSKNWPHAEQLVQEFNTELARFVAAGHRQRIFEKYRIMSDLDGVP